MMNPETRAFEPVTPEAPAGWAKFTEGEVITLRGATWRVTRCEGADLTLTFVNMRPDSRLRRRLFPKR